MAGPSRQDFINEALQYGIPQGAINDFLAKNPGDEIRILSALSADYEQGTGRPIDNYQEAAGGYQSPTVSALVPYTPNQSGPPGEGFKYFDPNAAIVSTPFINRAEIAAAWLRNNPRDGHRMVEALGSEYKPYQDAYMQGMAIAMQPALGSAITTQGASLPSFVEPTSGPIGLAYPSDPVNYATMRQSPLFGYADGLTSGTYAPTGNYAGGLLSPSTFAPAAPVAGGAAAVAAPDNTMTYMLLAGMAVAAYLLMK